MKILNWVGRTKIEGIELRKGDIITISHENSLGIKKELLTVKTNFPITINEIGVAKCLIDGKESIGTFLMN